MASANSDWVNAPARLISFNFEISTMMAHINSYTREKLNNKSPFELFSFLYGNDILDKLGQFLVEPNEIILKPVLLK